MTNAIKNIFILWILLVPIACSQVKATPGQVSATVPERHFSEEVVYHLFLRSFYDANGDLHGDLDGLTSKLDYLEDLGVTTLLLTPLYPSRVYHNYFPTSFEGIDQEYGTEEDFAELISELHRRDMKFLMDMEIHYVTEDHEWMKDSWRNPGSKYSDYIFYNGPGNTGPESMIFFLKYMPSYTGERIRTTTTDMHNEGVKKYHYDLFKYWVDPNQDGDFSDGVDGFRIDHMMDDLDGKGIVTNMFEDFWAPLFAELRAINPNLVIVGEQADWSNYGEDYFAKGEVDGMFAFNVRQAIVDKDARAIATAVEKTLEHTPDDKHQLVFIENHDIDRYATLVESHPLKMRVAAGLNLLLMGTPSLYYGQEIGMRGKTQHFKSEKIPNGDSDGNDIPRREAFEWYADIEGQGTALWYKNTGPWWGATELRANDGVSVEEQSVNPDSLLNYYKALMTLRSSYTALQHSEPVFIDNANEAVLSYVRADDNACLVVLINLSEADTSTKLTGQLPKQCDQTRLTPVKGWSDKPISLDSKMTLDAGQILVYQN